MTSDKFLETLELVRDVDEESKLQIALDAVSNTLVNLVSSPAEPSYQSTLATSLERLERANAASSARLGISELKAISSMGGEEYFASDIAQKVKLSVANNAMTPTVARDFVKDLASKRTAFMKTVENTIEGLTSLGVTGYALPAGGSDLSFTIPREIFADELASFAIELRFLDKLLRDLSEATLGKPEPVKLEALSTTTPVVSVLTDPHVLNALAKSIQFFLDAWKKIEDIRKVRSEVARVGVVGSALEQFDEKIEETVTEVVEETVKLSLANYSTDEHRKNELTTALSQDMRRLFGQIERGLVVEFRAKPEELERSDSSEGDPLISVLDISKNLLYPIPDSQPLLLASGELLEGEITRTTKKSTTTTKISKAQKSAS